MPKSSSSLETQSSLEDFTILNYGSVSVSAGPAKFGFEIEVTPSVVLSEVFVGLAQAETAPGEQRVCFGIRIDWERGEIWDALNGCGMIGWLPDSWEFTKGTLRISFQIERIGSAMFPTLIIGNEEWLYPTIRSRSPMEMLALAGTRGNTMRPLDPEDIFDEPYVWSGQRR
jgi:hypothetical protein